MLIQACIAKIHRATVTEANLNYVGSITLDKDLIEAAGIRPFQKVTINNVSNGAHWQTYVLEGKRGGKSVCLNGPPARHFHPGDTVIIVAYALLEPKEFDTLNPIVVFVDKENTVTEIKKHHGIPVQER